MARKQGFVYIMGNRRPTLYIGVTSNLLKRVDQHWSGKLGGFSKRYQLNRLLYYEIFPFIGQAIKREKQLKYWRREWKLDLIKSKNPTLKDLYYKIS